MIQLLVDAADGWTHWRCQRSTLPRKRSETLSIRPRITRESSVKTSTRNAVRFWGDVFKTFAIWFRFLPKARSC